MTPTARLTTALRSLADALEGNGRHPLPCSDPEMPARRLLDLLNGYLSERESLLYIADLMLKQDTDALDALCDTGLCDE